MASMALETVLSRGSRLVIGLAVVLVYGWLTFNAAPADEPVDVIVKKKLADTKPASTDEEFIRRIYLDLTGVLPTVDDTTKFLANKDPSELAAWFNPAQASRGTILPPLMHCGVEYVRAVSRAKLPVRERLLCYPTVIVVWYSRQFRGIAGGYRRRLAGFLQSLKWSGRTPSVFRD